jgi:hypothetical protein
MEERPIEVIFAHGDTNQQSDPDDADPIKNVEDLELSNTGCRTPLW